MMKMMFFFILLTALYVQARELPVVSVEQLHQPLQAVAGLSFWSQKALLQEIGEDLGSSGLQCNIFGGKGRCVDVPLDGTSFETTCGGRANRTVDCAFTFQASGAVQRSPVDRLKKEGYGQCEDCSTAVERFWCGQTLPPCGTFDHVVDELLPYIVSVVTKKSSMLGALKDAAPRVFQSMSLGLPCRSMCEAITNTCGCGHSHTFGEVMNSLMKDSKADNFNVSISASSATDIFSGIWHTPVCELFSEESTPGFQGSCQAVNTNTKCDWCKGKAQPLVSHQQLVIQLSQMFYGIMQGGLHHVLKAAAGGKGGLEDNWSQSLYASSESGEVNSSHHAGVLFLLFLLLAIAVGGFFVAVRSHRHTQVPSQYIDLNSMGYTPPML